MIYHDSLSWIKVPSIAPPAKHPFMLTHEVWSRFAHLGDEFSEKKQPKKQHEILKISANQHDKQWVNPLSKNMRKKKHMQKHMVIYTISYDITAHIRYIPSTRPNKNPTKPDLLCADFEVFIPGGAKRQGAIMEQHLGWSQSRSRGHGPKSSIKRTST